MIILLDSLRVWQSMAKASSDQKQVAMPFHVGKTPYEPKLMSSAYHEGVGACHPGGHRDQWVRCLAYPVS